MTKTEHKAAAEEKAAAEAKGESSDSASALLLHDDALSEVSDTVYFDNTPEQTRQSACAFHTNPFDLMGPLLAGGTSSLFQEAHDANPEKRHLTYIFARGVVSDAVPGALHMHCNGRAKCNFLTHGSFARPDVYNFSMICESFDMAFKRSRVSFETHLEAPWLAVLANACRTVDRANRPKREQDLLTSKSVQEHWGEERTEWIGHVSLELSEFFRNSGLDTGKKEIFSLMTSGIIRAVFLDRDGHPAKMNTCGFQSTKRREEWWELKMREPAASALVQIKSENPDQIWLPDELALQTQDTRETMERLLLKVDGICNFFDVDISKPRVFSANYRSVDGSLKPFSGGTFASVMRSRISTRVDANHFSFVFTLFNLLNHLKRFAIENIGEQKLDAEHRRIALVSNLVKQSDAVAPEAVASEAVASEAVASEAEHSDLLKAFASEATVLEDEKKVLFGKERNQGDLARACKKLGITPIPKTKADMEDAIKAARTALASEVDRQRAQRKADPDTYGLEVARQILGTQQPDSSYFNIMRTLLSNLINCVNILLEYVEKIDGIPHTKDAGGGGTQFVLFMNAAHGLCDYDKFKQAFTGAFSGAHNVSDDLDNLQRTIDELKGTSPHLSVETLNNIAGLEALARRLRMVSEINRTDVEERQNIWLCMHLQGDPLQSSKNHFKKLMANIMFQLKSNFSKLGGGNNQSKSLTNKKNIKKVSKKTNYRRLSLQNRNIYKSKNRNNIKNKFSKRK